MLTSLGEQFTSVIVGAHGGIGNALLQNLMSDSNCRQIFALSRSGITVNHDKVKAINCDLLDEDSLGAAAGAIPSDEPWQLAIIATGVLHQDGVLAPEKTWRQLAADKMALSYALNTIGPALMVKQLLPLMAKRQRAVLALLSARVGSIGDDEIGGWYSYRAAKAALNMFIKNFAIEVTRSHPHAIIVGLHPGTVDTKLSQPFQSRVNPEDLFSPEYSAQRLLEVIDKLSPAESGNIIAYDGSRIPY